MQAQLALFDYSQLDAPTRSFVEQRTSEIRMLVRRTAQDIIGIGQRLQEIKDRLGHGFFLDWLETEFGWSERMARNFMRVALWAKSANFADLNFAPSALYLLSAPSTPEEARQEALERAEEGEQITHSVAQEIIEEHKEEQAEETEEDPQPEPERVPERFVCPDCGEIFQSEVWHCAYCHSHWAPQQERCLGCDHKAATPAEKKALAILEQEAPDLLEQVRSGDLSIVQARREMVRRQAREAPPLPTNKYRVIYADPPWSYGNTQPDYHPEQRDHYPVMPLSEICALPVKDMADDNAVLFLWVTTPILEEAFEVINAWGFKYKALFVWDKIAHNMGHYNSVRCELLLICVRGSCQPDVIKLFDNVVSIERTEHSVKPEEFRTIIDTIYPYGKRIELFARRRPPDNWEMWGNESE